MESCRKIELASRAIDGLSSDFPYSFPYSDFRAMTKFLSDNRNADSLEIRGIHKGFLDSFKYPFQYENNKQKTKLEAIRKKALEPFGEIDAKHITFEFCGIDCSDVMMEGYKRKSDYLFSSAGDQVYWMHAFAEEVAKINPNLLSINVEMHSIFRGRVDHLRLFSYSTGGYKGHHDVNEMFAQRMTSTSSHYLKCVDGFISRTKEAIASNKRYGLSKQSRERFVNECSNTKSLEQKLCSAGDALPQLFQQIGEIYDQLPRTSHMLLAENYGFAKQNSAEPLKLDARFLVSTTGLIDRAPQFYRAIEAGQFPEIYDMVVQGKANLTPQMLLYRPRTLGGLTGAPAPTTLELLMQQGYLPQLFSKELWRYKSPFPLEDIAQALPKKAFENQVGTEKLLTLIHEINQENLDGVEQIAALIRQRARTDLEVMDEDLLPTLQHSLSKAEAIVGNGSKALTDEPNEGSSPLSKILPDGRIILLPPRGYSEDAAMQSLADARTPVGKDIATKIQLYPYFRGELEKIDRSPGSWLVPEGSPPNNPMRDYLLAQEPEDSPLHKLALKPPKRPAWMQRVEHKNNDIPKPSPRH